MIKEFFAALQNSSLRICLPSTLALCCMISAAVQAQNTSELMATYGRGVHAYFAGDTARAEELFSQVIGAGATDPRVFYFRAMTRLRSGRQHEAEHDMQIGAAFEARNPGVQHQIGRSLQRIQGPHRRTLEKYRRQARLNRIQERQQQTRQRYEQLQQRESKVLRQQAPVPLDQLVEPSLILPGQAGPPPSSDAPPPAATNAPQPTLAAPPQPAAPAVEPEEDFDPFEDTGKPGDDAMEQPVDDENDIFSEPDQDDEETEDDPFAVSTPRLTSKRLLNLAEVRRRANHRSPSR